MIVIGVDVHKQSLTAVAVDEAGRMLDEKTVAAADGRLFALPNYTALIELRTLLASRGLAREFWR